MRIRSLYKLPDGRDWMWGKLCLSLTGKAMLSKSFIFWWVGLCSLPVVWPNYGRGNGDLLPKDLCEHAIPPRTASVSVPDPAAGHCRPTPPSETPKYSEAIWVSCGVTAPLSWVLVCTRFCLCPPRVSVSPVLWKFCNRIPLTCKVRFPGDSQSLCWIPRLGSLLWALEFLQQC